MAFIYINRPFSGKVRRFDLSTDKKKAVYAPCDLVLMVQKARAGLLGHSDIEAILLIETASCRLAALLHDCAYRAEVARHSVTSANTSSRSTC